MTLLPTSVCLSFQEAFLRYRTQLLFSHIKPEQVYSMSLNAYLYCCYSRDMIPNHMSCQTLPDGIC